MRNIIVLFFIVFCTSQLYSQKAGTGLRAELGFAGGGLFYLGDVNKEKLFYNSKPGFGGIFRYNFNTRWALRLTGIIGSIGANDADFESGYQKMRDYEFSANITDINLQLEINFLELAPSQEGFRWTPFVCGGLGAFLLSGDDVESSTQISIPYGIGVKYCPSERFSMGIEWGMRSTFSDDLDGLTEDFKSNEEGYMAHKQKTFLENNDHFSYFGVFFSYKFFTASYSCPAFGRNTKYKK